MPIMISFRGRTSFLSIITRVKREIRARLFVFASITCITLFLSSFLVAQQISTQTHGVTVSSSDIVRAGEKISFTITLDQAPNFNGGQLHYRLDGPDSRFAISSGIILESGKRVYKMDVEIPGAAEGGTWTLSNLSLWLGFGAAVPLKFKPVSFRVMPNSNLIFPAAADARVNPSQIQLLRLEAGGVQARIQTLKADLARVQPPLKRDQLIAFLRRNLNEALEAVGRTELSFHKLGGPQSNLEAGKVFFADLQASYRQALEDLARAQAQIRIEPRVDQVSFVNASQTTTNQPRYPAIAQGVLRVLEQNELAYSVVANKEDLTFNLEVNSIPAGATVVFWRRGDSERKNNKPTNSTIPSLAYAIWFVRFHVPGYKDEEREHDPFREPNHVVTVELQKP
jgi:hypothetical protein